ncbi:hypothetical protein OK016_26970 [Vibrio chagasii]|nr:hypothetical protein [Vibrio chagasii]
MLPNPTDMAVISKEKATALCCGFVILVPFRYQLVRLMQTVPNYIAVACLVRVAAFCTKDHDGCILV